MNKIKIYFKRSLRSLIYGGMYRSNDANKVSGVYRLTVKQAADSTSPGNNILLKTKLKNKIQYEINKNFFIKAQDEELVV